MKSTNLPALARLRKGGAGGQTADVDADYVREGATNAEFQDGLPLLKPPYGHLTAIDLNKGKLAWQVPFGDNAARRAHPALQGVTLPKVLRGGGRGGSDCNEGRTGLYRRWGYGVPRR